MTVERRIIFAIASGWGSKAINILINLVQIPLLYRYLNGELLGVWFLMIGAQAVVGLFDFGFGQTLQRRIAFHKGTCGSSPDLELSDAAKLGISELLTFARSYYYILSSAVSVILVVGGLFYFLSLDLSPATLNNLRLAWIIMAVGYAANMWGWFVEATLNGLGDIGWSSLITGVLRIFEFLAIWLVLALGYSLAALAVIWFLRGILTRLIGWLIIRTRHPWIAALKRRGSAQQVKTMIRSSLEWWIAMLSYFFLAGISRYLIASIMGAKYVPDYVSTYTALVIVQGTLMSIVTVATPLLSQMWQAGSLEDIQRIMLNLMHIAIVLLLSSYVFICIYGREIFELWLGKGHFVGYPVLVILAIMMLLEAHQGILMTACLAAEKMQFYKFVVLGGIISLPLSYWLISYYGLMGAALAILISGLLTQNWAIPWLSLQVLKLEFQLIAHKILFPALALGGLVALLGIIIKTTNLSFPIGIFIYALGTSVMLAIMMHKQILSGISYFKK